MFLWKYIYLPVHMALKLEKHQHIYFRDKSLSQII